MALLAPFLPVVVILLATRWVFRTILGRGRRRRWGGSFLRSTAGAWDAAGSGVLLGASMGVALQATLATSAKPFDWLGLVASAGVITFLVWMVPSFRSGAPFTIGTTALEVLIGAFATSKVVYEVITGPTSRSDKASFLVPLFALLGIGLSLAAKSVMTSAARFSPQWRSIGDAILLALLGTELALGMHLPPLASFARLGRFPHFLILLLCVAALVLVVVVPVARTPIGLAVAFIALAGDWSAITVISTIPVPGATVTAAAMAIEVAAVYLGTAVRHAISGPLPGIPGLRHA